MKLQTLICACLCVCLAPFCLTAADPVAADLARRAEKARNSGQVVRAYQLYAEAAARDPQTMRYIANRDALAPAARVLIKTDVQDSGIAEDLREAEAAGNHAEPPIELVQRADWQHDPDLAPLPQIQSVNKITDFDLRGDERVLFQDVAAVYGLKVTFDPTLDLHPNLHFVVAQADFHTALEALADATGTFVFPVAATHLFVIRNSEEKRSQYEPQALLTFALPDALEQKDLVEAANAVRTVLNIRAIGWDSLTRTVMVRDRASRAHIAFELLEAVLLPRSEVSLEVRVLTVDSERAYHYGVALPTSYQLAFFGHTTGGFKNVLGSLGSTALNFASFGGGASIFGVALSNANVFATFSDSYSHNLYDATVRVSGGQTASFHVGDQYPIAQSLYTGFSQSNPSIYTPAPQIQLVDLGLVLKMSPRVSGDGNISIDVEAEYKALGNQTFNTVPTILQRSYKGSVSLREGESAIIAGLDSESDSVTRNGLAGLSSIPGLNQVLSENSRDHQSSRTLIVIRPTVLRLPMSAAISPQYFVGPQRGQAVLF